MLIPVILAGGSGTRLWPVSREARPKPFMPFPDGQSLLQKTMLRASALEGVGEIMTIAHRDHYFMVRDEYRTLRDASSPVRDVFLLEPTRRGTAAAIAMAALAAQAAHGEQATLLILPADHFISDMAAFQLAVKQAQAIAEQGRLLTFGVVPTAAETGYGYIEIESATSDASRKADAGLPVVRFIEKPSVEVAQTLSQTGTHFWNSGMFCFSAQTLLAELALHAPAIHQQAAQCWAASVAAPASAGWIELEAARFAAIPNDSIDYALMEKSSAISMLCCEFGWDDIGTWDKYARLGPVDDEGNCVAGDVVLKDAADCIVQGKDRLIAAIGISNLLIVDTPDALLVADRRRDAEVKHLVATLQEMGHESSRTHRMVARPWGSYTVLQLGKQFKIKCITVHPGAALSLQMHYHRSEHWVVVSGTAQITKGESSYLVRSDESTYIPCGVKHRLENPGLVDLVIIEIQSGQYLGEDDIVRFDDAYGRV